MRGIRLWSGAIVAVTLSLALGLVPVGAAPAPEGGEPAHPQLVNGVAQSGTLTGNRAGAFAYYSVDYPGDLRVVTIKLDFAPADPVTRNGVGFNVYGPNGYWIGQGAESEDQDGVPAQLQYSDANPARWLVQVYNYLPAHQVRYSIVAEGLPEVSQPPVSTEAHPVEPQPERPQGWEGAVAGTLTGKSAGAFAFYHLPYAGDGSEIQVIMSYAPDNALIARGVGFVVYGPDGEVARGQRTATPGKHRAAWSAHEAVVYLVQVFNYIEGLQITYALTQ